MFEGKKAVDMLEASTTQLMLNSSGDSTTSAVMLSCIALSLARLSDDIHELLEKENDNG